MFKIQYWRRIFAAYVLRKTSQLSFWHEEPNINKNFDKKTLGPYYMSFTQKANYNSHLDQKGIPLLDYQGQIGKQYNPIAISQWGLGNYNLWKLKSNEYYKDKFLVCADWMEKNLFEKNGLRLWFHDFDFEYRDTLKKPWYSGLELSALSPPSWVFGPIWTTLYIFMSIAIWRVWIKFHETKILKLNSKKAYKKLRWKTLLNLDQIGMFITNWYKIYFRKNSNMYDFTIKQIKEYEKKTFN